MLGTINNLRYLQVLEVFFWQHSGDEMGDMCYKQ